MKINRITIAILIILFLLPINVFADLSYGKVGADTNFNGDVNIPTGNNYYIDGQQISIFNLADVSVDPNADKFMKWDDDPGTVAFVDLTEADIYKKHVDGIDESDEISTKVDTTNNTLDCATIVANEDITVWYHN